LKIGVKQKKDVKVSLTDDGNDSDSIKSAECDEKRSYTPEPTAQLSHLQKTEESKAFSQSLIG
jgi:hypothetical protein